jgi:hypothetical protein
MTRTYAYVVPMQKWLLPIFSFSSMYCREYITTMQQCFKLLVLLIGHYLVYQHHELELKQEIYWLNMIQRYKPVILLNPPVTLLTENETVGARLPEATQPATPCFFCRVLGWPPRGFLQLGPKNLTISKGTNSPRRARTRFASPGWWWHGHRWSQPPWEGTWQYCPILSQNNTLHQLGNETKYDPSKEDTKHDIAFILTNT